MDELKSNRKVTVLTFQDANFEPAGCVVALQDSETIKLLKSRRRIQVSKADGRDATPATLTESDLLENDNVKLNQNFNNMNMQQSENQFAGNVEADLNDIVNDVSCVFLGFLISVSCFTISICMFV
jgi:hypothetical protein